MRDEYDLDAMAPRPNPYLKGLRKQVTIRLGEDVLEYFKALAVETGLPYQRLIDFYLRDCVVHGRKPALTWDGAA